MVDMKTLTIGGKTYNMHDETARKDMSDHLANKSNPHGVTPYQINAVNKDGDTMAGNLTIEKSAAPQMILSNTGTSRKCYSIAGAAGQLDLINRADDSNYVYFRVNSEAKDLDALIQVIRKVSGTETTYKILHTGNANAGTITAGTFAGQVKANATAAATVGTAQVRNISAGTTDLTAGSSALATGDLYLVYE